MEHATLLHFQPTSQRVYFRLYFLKVINNRWVNRALEIIFEKFLGYDLLGFYICKNVTLTNVCLIDENTDIAENLYQKVRILCWVMTSPQNLEKKAKHVKATWAQRCNKVLFMSSEENQDFPTVGLKTKEGREQLYWKTIKAFQYVYDHYLEDADWFMKADDDTYVILDNLRWLLSKYNPEQPIYFGRRFKPYVKQGYMSGGAGYVLSKEALRRFVDAFKTEKCTHSSSIEDLALGRCMEIINVEAGDSRDTTGKETFHPFVPEHHLIKGYLPKTFWYWNYNYYPPVEVSLEIIITCFNVYTDSIAKQMRVEGLASHLVDIC